MSEWDIIQGDVFEVLDRFEEGEFDACFCDPPYGLSGQPNINEAMNAWMKDEEYSPSKGGFMGEEWDSFPPGPRVWKKVKRVLKPGANVFSFSGTQTSDLISIAMRMAGLYRFDSVAYTFGSGFPKNHDISKNIDKQKGAERKVVGEYDPRSKYDGKNRTSKRGDFVFQANEESVYKIEKPATTESKKWDGWGTALKPSREDILCFRKPRDGTYVNNALEHGVSGINIDGCRISIGNNEDPDLGGNGYWGMDDDKGWNKNNVPYYNDNISSEEQPEGRYPANTILGHHPECGVKCHEDCAVRLMDESSGDLHSQNPETRRKSQNSEKSQYFSTGKSSAFNDSGGASRFFYTSKASRAQREAGLLDLKEDYNQRSNHHPCVKPIDLCRWVSKLMLPPPRENSDRKMLVVFSGSGSEMIGALLAGWDNVVGIELEEEYVEIAEKRIEWWQEHGDDAIDSHKSLKKRKKKEEESGQNTLFDD